MDFFLEVLIAGGGSGGEEKEEGGGAQVQGQVRGQGRRLRKG